MIREADSLNPGPWVRHSWFTACAAQAIARHHPRLDPETAFVLGYLHDIGRRAGKTDMRHTLDGFRFLKAIGFDDAARICITHVFPIKDIHSVAGKWDCSDTEMDFLIEFLERTEFDEYDRLIQLCDALALPTGICRIEKRLLDVDSRYGINSYSIPRRDAFLRIQKEMETSIGQSVYRVFSVGLGNSCEFNPDPP